jgi:hypothetical protein
MALTVEVIFDDSTSYASIGGLSVLSCKEPAVHTTIRRGVHLKSASTWADDDCSRQVIRCIKKDNAKAYVEVAAFNADGTRNNGCKPFIIVFPSQFVRMSVEGETHIWRKVLNFFR